MAVIPISMISIVVYIQNCPGYISCLSSLFYPDILILISQVAVVASETEGVYPSELPGLISIVEDRMLNLILTFFKVNFSFWILI